MSRRSCGGFMTEWMDTVDRRQRVVFVYRAGG